MVQKFVIVFQRVNLKKKNYYEDRKYQVQG